MRCDLAPTHSATATSPTRLDDARDLHQRGCLEAAKEVYLEILARDPKHADAWHLLGMLLYQGGHAKSALECLHKADALAPDHPELLSNLGVVYLALRELPLARASLERAVAARPDSVSALNNLGTVLLELRDYAAAEQRFREALQHQPRHHQALSNLGNALQHQLRQREALECHRRVLLDDADNLAALNNLGACLMSMGRQQEAVEAFQRAVTVCPTSTEARINLGRAFLGLRRSQEAMDCFEQLLAREPQSPQGHHYLGQALEQDGQHDRSLGCLRRAIELDPNYAHAHSALAFSYQRRGDLAKAGECHRTALDLRPDSHDTHSCLLFMMSGDPTVSPEQLLQEHLRWGEMHGQVEFVFPQRVAKADVLRPLRVGYVSPDFRDHAVTAYFGPVLQNHSSESVETFCYSELSVEDDVTQQLKQHANHWRATCGISDRQVAQMIHDDQIDILVDLAGHTAGNRLRALAYKPAPVQVTWLGYPNTTGLKAVDYFLTNAIQNPPDEQFHTEELVRLEIDTCFCPPAAAPDVGPCPAREPGRVTLGSLHRYQKISQQVLDLWAQVMRALPSARLLLFHTSLTGDVKDHLHTQLTRRGIDPRRFELLDQTDDPHYLYVYHRIDIGLDVFPWNGGTTVREALWMGVPVVGLYGDRSSARSTAAALHQAGLPELIARSPSEYVQIVEHLSNDLNRLQDLRDSIRRRVRDTLCNAPAVTRGIERAYRQMWRKWCQSPQVTNACSLSL